MLPAPGLTPHWLMQRPTRAHALWPWGEPAACFHSFRATAAFGSDTIPMPNYNQLEVGGWGKSRTGCLFCFPWPLEPQGAHGAHPKSIFLQVYFLFYQISSKPCLAVPHLLS